MSSAVFQVKWSDSSSSSVTKTHLELENFLLKVSTLVVLLCNDKIAKAAGHPASQLLVMTQTFSFSKNQVKVTLAPFIGHVDLMAFTV